MENKCEYIKSFDGNEIFVREWNNAQNPKAVVMIIHGMVEHSARYEEFANYLNQNNFLVFGYDQRSHGQTVKNAQDVGKYNGNLFEDCVCDAMFFADQLKEKYNLPLIVVGHSYGSFVLQRFVERYNKHSMAIFVGSACMKGQASVNFGLFVAGVTKFFCGKNAKAKMIYKASFSGYEKKFENGNWLTRDKEIFNKYKADPFCQQICSANFYHSFFKNMKKIYKKSELNKVNLSIPILIISGSSDPVGGFGKLTTKLKKLYDGLGVKNCGLKLYEGGRHEILNETNRKEVFDYILNFINSNLTNDK